MGEYILINDVHLKDRAPAMCTDTYLDDLFTLLDEAAKLANTPNDKAIILAGDVFHDKTPSRTSHGTVIRLIDWARSCPVPVYAVLGNHDIQHDRLDSIDESQPLGVVIRSGAVKLLDGWMGDGSPVYGVPWQMTFDDETVQTAFEKWRLFSGHGDHQLVVTHAPLYPPGQELKFEFYPTDKWADAMGGRGTVHYGHVHHPHGVYEVGGVVFSNCGALSRGSLTEYNTKRVPSVGIWDSDTGLIRHVQLPAKPASEVFRMAEAQAAKTAGLELTSFLSAVQATQLDITSTDAVMDHVKGMDLGPALTTAIAKLLSDAA